MCIYGLIEISGGCVYDGVFFDMVVVCMVDGELCIVGFMFVEGYLGDGELIVCVFVCDEFGICWYCIGDFGFVEDGVVCVYGCVDNVIVLGGVNILFDWVEWVVCWIFGLYEVVVIGVEDECWGEVLVIVVVCGEVLWCSELE